jgi:molybdenum cofactor biosynthesis enzyme MoaA
MTPKLIAADDRGAIGTHRVLAAMGQEAGSYFSLAPDDLIPMPAGSQLFMLPERSAVGYDQLSGLPMPVFGTRAVAAFLPPGYTVTHTAAYPEDNDADMLPLFSYAAVAYYNGRVHAAAIRVDKDRRHDCSLMDMGDVRRGASRLKRIFPKNRLIRHLEQCALKHGCPNARNFFLSRYEAPLPVSPSCNSSCKGCISYQPSKKIPATQPRIKFVPTADELAQVAIYHLDNVKKPIVSFGQGCEGEPLMQARIVEKAVQMIRAATRKGVINMNTNASSPQALKRLFDAGLNSIRVSINSARSEYYNIYYSPRGYSFKDVMRSISEAKSRKAFVSLNYLTMPGFTDTREELHALEHLIADRGVDMIQWRNLNYDPAAYFRAMRYRPELSSILGIRNTMQSLRRRFPRLRHGYFNPSDI